MLCFVGHPSAAGIKTLDFWSHIDKINVRMLKVATFAISSIVMFITFLFISRTHFADIDNINLKHA